MAKTLAELRQSPHVGPIEQVYPICVAGKLVAQYEEARAAAQVAAENEPKGKPGRVGAKSVVREKIEAAEAIRREMEEHLVLVKFRKKPDHEWRDWVAEHPPREDNKEDARFDLNVDDLIESVQNWVIAINDETPNTGDAEWVFENAAYGDKKNAAIIVFNLQRMTVNIPKSLMTLLETQEKSDDSE